MRVHTHKHTDPPGTTMLALRHGVRIYQGGREVWSYTFMLGRYLRTSGTTTYLDVTWRVSLCVYGPHVGLPQMRPWPGEDYYWHDGKHLSLVYPGDIDLTDRIGARRLVKDALPLLEPYLIMCRDSYLQRLSNCEDEDMIPDVIG